MLIVLGIKKRTVPHVQLTKCLANVLRGGSVAEWSAPQTRNPAVPGYSRALTTTGICFLEAPEFKSSAALRKATELVCPRPNLVPRTFTLACAHPQARVKVLGTRLPPTRWDF